jgi:hypothetical protein
MSETPTTTIVVATAAATTIPDEEVADKDAEAAEETIMIRTINQLRNLTCYNCDKKDTIPRTARHPRKMEMNTQTWFKKRISKICFNPHLKRCTMSL